LEINLVDEALKFMALGMGVVFAFLVIMIFMLKLQTVLINKFFKDESKNKIPSKQWQPKPTDNKNLVAAITAAIIHHNIETNNKG